MTTKKPAKSGAKRPGRKKSVKAGVAARVAKGSSAVSSRGVDFPVVGIGASAGGLEALESFLRHVPAGSGMAFVIVQHQDPTHPGLMPELLQRATAMPVCQVRDRMAVRPDHVYVIPPNKEMSILHGVLHLFPPTAARGLRLPIDSFFRSLADDQEDRSVGVVLSGMGSDGTLGLQAIKEKAGVVFVQALDSAKFDGMPRSAVDAGLADVVAPVEELPDRIAAFLHLSPVRKQSGMVVDEEARNSLDKVVILLRSHTGHDFSQYKKTTVYRRIERRMGIHQIARASDYVRFLRENPQERDLLFKELLIGVTRFFRDPAAWERLKREIVPALVAARPAGQALRAWVAGCSTGEEAYSLAIVFKEAMEKSKPGGAHAVQIFATDLDPDAIDKAREGVYPGNIAADVSPDRLERFFVKTERGYQIAKPIREMVIFAPQNVVMAPPFNRLDLLSCRNLLIYLTPEVQKKLLPLFHHCLNPDGCLFLGSAETVGECTDLFEPLDAKARLYRRREPVMGRKPLEFPSRFSPPPPPEPVATVSLKMLADHLLLQRFTPAAVLVNDKGDILYISGKTGKYLEPAAGKANWNIFAMAREGLAHELADGFRRALRKGKPVQLKGLQVGTNGGTQAIDVGIQPLAEPQALRGMVLIVFTEVETLPDARPMRRSGRARAAGSRAADLAKEIESARHEARIMHEEMQSSQEELMSANEELQSTNEELQSTNEELTTSKEEMQSMNEELQTLNQELQAKVDELSLASNDMKNLLDSTDNAVLFLDNELNVRRFTPQTQKIIHLIPGDVGRPFGDLTTAMIYPALADDAREVLRTLVFVEREIATDDGRHFAVRIMPYRTLDNVIDGVVITFADVTKWKEKKG